MTGRVAIFGELFTPVAFGETRFFDLPCVYLMAHEDGGGFAIHYVGQTARLNARYAGHHQLGAAKAAGATHALVLVVPDRRDRRELETLLRWAYRPPLNREETPTAMQAWRAAMHCGKPEAAELARAAHFSGAAGVAPPWANRPVARSG